MVNELLGIQYNIRKANVTDRKVQNLASYLNTDTLAAIHKTMKGGKASGIGQVTKEEYETNMKGNIENHVKRMKCGSYKPNPTRRVYIPKEAECKMRPLGISCYEDKLVENAMAQILEQIYESKFYMDGKKQFYRCRVKTSKKKLRSKIKQMKEWIKDHRTMPLEMILKTVNAKLRGHYQYYGVTENTREVKNYHTQTKWLLFKWLNRRSQRRSYNRDTFYNGLLRAFPLLEPSIKVSLFYR